MAESLAPAVGFDVSVTPPHDEDAEKSVMCACLTAKDAVGRAGGILASEHFYFASHKLLWEVFWQMHESGQAIDMVTVANELKRKGLFEKIGGHTYLSELIAFSASHVNLENHADIIRDHGRRRAIAEQCRLLYSRAISGATDSKNLVDQGDRFFHELAAAPTSGKPAQQLVCLADVEPAETTWLWYPRIPRGHLILLFGDGGVGKSHLALAIASALSLGKGLPGCAKTGDPTNSVIFTGEDQLGEMRRRLDDMEADGRYVHACGETFELGAAGIRFIEESIAAHNAKLAVVDPVVAFLGSKIDFFRANETRSILAPLAAVAERTNASIILVTHVTKGSMAKAAHRALGSGDFVNAARSALLAGTDPDDERHRALIHVKANLGPTGEPIGYAIDRGKFRWTGDTSLSADKILGTGSGDGNLGRRAEEFLKEVCREERWAKEVTEQGEKEGISGRTLQRAVDRLCNRRREGFGKDSKIFWMLKSQHIDAT